MQPGVEADRCVLGLGDSLQTGPGDAALGVAPRPWSQWVAESLDLPFHRLALDGGRAADIATALLPRARFEYAVACVGVGVNDARSLDLDPEAFELAVATILDGLRAQRICVATVPLDLGRPRAGAQVVQCNAILRRLATQRDAVIVDLDDLAGWRLVMPDAVHPTALGQLEIADRAARALELDVLPSALTDIFSSPRSVARYAITRHAPMVLRDWRRRLRER